MAPKFKYCCFITEVDSLRSSMKFTFILYGFWTNLKNLRCFIIACYYFTDKHPFSVEKMENFTFFILEFIILLAFHKKKFWGSVILRIFTIIENILIFFIVLVVFVRTTVTSPEVNDLSTQTIWKDYCEEISSLTKSTLLIWPFFCEKPKLTSLKSIIYTISI